jgi:hypothetical protein
MTVGKGRRGVSLEGIDSPALAFIRPHKDSVLGVARKIGVEITLMCVYVKAVNEGVEFSRSALVRHALAGEYQERHQEGAA